MYVVEVAFFQGANKRFEVAKHPEIGGVGQLIIFHPEGLIVYAAGRWAGVSVKNAEG